MAPSWPFSFMGPAPCDHYNRLEFIPLFISYLRYSSYSKYFLSTLYMYLLWFFLNVFSRIISISWRSIFYVERIRESLPGSCNSAHNSLFYIHKLQFVTGKLFPIFSFECWMICIISRVEIAYRVGPIEYTVLSYVHCNSYNIYLSFLYFKFNINKIIFILYSLTTRVPPKSNSLVFHIPILGHKPITVKNCGACALIYLHISFYR